MNSSHCSPFYVYICLSWYFLTQNGSYFLTIAKADRSTRRCSYETAGIFLLSNTQNWRQKWVLSTLPLSPAMQQHRVSWDRQVKYRVFNSVKRCILLWSLWSLPELLLSVLVGKTAHDWKTLSRHKSRG